MHMARGVHGQSSFPIVRFFVYYIDAFKYMLASRKLIASLIQGVTSALLEVGNFIYEVNKIISNPENHHRTQNRTQILNANPRDGIDKKKKKKEC